jgi:AcrR family transcriptional regulator
MTEKGRRSVQRILDAAEAVVAEEGHAGATTRRIATAAGVDKRVLSYYFDSREALLAEVVSRTAGRVADAIAEDLREVDDPRRMLDTVWTRIVAEPALVRTYVAILGSDASDGQMASVIRGMNVEYTALFRAALVKLGHEAGAATSLANATTVTIRGLLLSWAEGGPEVLIDDTLAMLAEACRVS